MAAYLGCTLEIETKDGKFEGVLIDIETGSKKITLNKVKVKPSGKRIRTPLHFYGNEVLELKVIPEKNKSKQNSGQSPDAAQTSPSNTNKDVLHNGPTNRSPVLDKKEGSSLHKTAESTRGHKHEKKQQQRDARESASVSEIVTSNRARDTGPSLSRPEKKSVSSTSSKSLVDSWQELKRALSSKGYILIDKIASDFTKVIKHLKEQHFLGLAVGGVNIGRRGELHIVQIYSDEVTYIFDVKSLGAALFNHERGGLGEVLESHSIVKVIHDCRWVSDLLHHVYGIHLNCVYDTQVADILVRRQENRGEVPRHSRGLAECLLEYLEISISEVYSKMVHSGLDMDEEFLWEERPLNSDLLDSAVRNVRYLLDLRVATLRRLMGELMCATEIYLTSVRDTPDSRTSRVHDPTLIPHGLSDLFRRGFRGMSDVYEEYQFGVVGEGDGQTSSKGAVPWDLWQPGQKLNPSLHIVNKQSQFADATANTDNKIRASDINLSQPKTSGKDAQQSGMPAGAEEVPLSDEASDSDEADVFGGDDTVYSWRRKPTIEGEEDQHVSLQSRTLPEKQVVEIHSSAVSSSPANTVLEQIKHDVNSTKAETYQKDQNLYKIPVVKCATDLYNLPVNGVETSSTDDESSPVEDSESTSEESGYKISEIESEAQEPIQWPVVASLSDFVARPAGIEEGTLFEALPSENERSPLRSAKPDVKSAAVEFQQPTEDFQIDRCLAADVPRQGSPLSIPDLEDEEAHAEDQDAAAEQSSSTNVHANHKATVHLNSQEPVRSEMPFKPSPHSPVDKNAPKDLGYSEQKSGASFYTPKGPVPHKKTQRPEQARYMPPRMRNLPPRFRKAQSTNVGNAFDAPEQHSPLSSVHRVPNGIVESGSESSSSSTSSRTTQSSGSGNNLTSTNRARRRSKQASPLTVEQNRSSPADLSRPATFGEVMASLSDSNQERDSDSSLGNAASGGKVPSGGDKTTSSSSEDLAMNHYDEMIAAREAAGTARIGRGRARALTVSVDHLPARRIPKATNVTTLTGGLVTMDYPSEYEIQHAPKAIPIRANSHLLSVKTIGRGGHFR